MKKVNFILVNCFLIVLLIGFISCSQSKKTDWEKDDLIGKVKSLTYYGEKPIKQLEEEPKKDELYFRGNFQKIYDKEGNIVEQNTYYSDGKIESKYTFQYNIKGICSEIKLMGYADDGHSTCEIVITPPKNIEKEKEAKKEDKNIYKFQYDKKGNWIKRTRYIDDVPVQTEERKFEYYE